MGVHPGRMGNVGIFLSEFLQGSQEMSKDVPLFLLAVTVCTYWGTVVLLVLYKRLRHGRSAGTWPRHGYERRLWVLIVPVVLAWILLPILACNSRLPWLSLPSWAQD